MQNYLLLNRGKFYAENRIVKKFHHLAQSGPVIMSHRVHSLPCQTT